MPWDAPLNSAVLAIHAALTATGDVLYFGGDEHSKVQHENNDVDNTRLYDPETNTVSTPPPPSSPTADVFCCGHAQMHDGRILVAGGTEDFPLPVGEFHHTHFPGLRDAWTYGPRGSDWVRVADMDPEPGHPERGGGRWYPTLVTLPNGEILALGGHPASTDRRPTHNNDSPERYSPGANDWHTLTATTVDCPNYPRVHLLPDGTVFINNPTGGQRRLYDPMAGVFVGGGIGAPGDGLYDGFGGTSVLLPLLPADGYRARVLVLGSEQPRRIELGVGWPAWVRAGSPGWVDAGTRQGAAAGRRRHNLCAVLLPTGQVFVSGGIAPDGAGNTLDANAVLEGELYTPGIDWATGAYSGADAWASTDAATVPRNYHSTALLLPDGRVWTGGSSKNAAEGLPGDVGQLQIEIFRPPYVGQPRPTITAAPATIGYGQQFEVRSGQAADVSRVALVRAGTVTHAFDSDQRYVVLTHVHAGGDRLTVTAPPSGAVAPPGMYMLWILDAAGRPSERAAMVRVGGMRAFVVTDRSTFSVHEVEALLPPHAVAPAVFPRSLYVVFEGFLPSELTTPPAVELLWEGTTTAVPGMTATYRSQLLEDPGASPDQAQRITYAFDVRFANDDAYDAVAEQRFVTVRATRDGHTATGRLALIRQPNPYMMDGPVSWLSTDVRVFQVREGGAQGGVVHGSGAGAPRSFLDGLLTSFNGAPNDEYHPFRDLSEDQTASKLELSRSVGGQRVYNYAVAKVRYRAASVPANDVRVFFRGFTTVGTALEYNPATTYRRSGTGATAVPLLGLTGGAITSMPFFAEPRVDTGAASMTTQTDPLNRRTLSPAGANEFVAYYGAWLDINQTEARFPDNPVGDGPWSGRRSIQEQLRGRHVCLVTEVVFDPDPTPAGATPASNDNLSQRNLAVVQSDNPGGPGSHRIVHTFELRPSIPLQVVGPRDERFFAAAAVAAPAAEHDHEHGDDHEHRDDHEHDDGGQQHGVAPLLAAAAPGQFGPDELLLQWNDLPRDTVATLYLPDVDIDEVIAMSASRLGPAVLEKVDEDTIRCRIADVTWLPLPGGRRTLIPGLLTLDLPDTVKRGQTYVVTAHQISGLTRGIIGAFQLTIPVSSAEVMLGEEVRTLAVLKLIAAGIPAGDRWYPVFRRYLEGVEGRVRGLGGNPDAVEPSPDGGPDDRPPRDGADGGDGQDGDGHGLDRWWKDLVRRFGGPTGCLAAGCALLLALCLLGRCRCCGRRRRCGCRC